MYPRLSDIFKDLFGIQLPFPIYSFGAMVALAFLAAAWFSRKELDRLFTVGRLNAVRIPVTVEKGKRKKKTMQEVSPGELMGTITIIAVVAGFIGAKIFHILENLGDFARDPLALIFSTGGFTFYGGLIVAAISIAYYVKSKGLDVRTVADALAPGLMISYGIGRIGCQLAGDGDWGIAANLAAKPSWLPMWLWAESYPNNILQINLANNPVYPTSIYEFVACTLLFVFLWKLRKHPYESGWLFSVYLIVNGIERFMIELIRVNNRMDLFGLSVTQAEVIAVLLVVAGLIGLSLTWKRREAISSAVPATAHAV